MKVLGITGSSGSGKSTVAELFMEFPKTVLFDADKVVKSLDYKNSEYLEEIKNILGEEILLKTGNLNRKLLAQIISKNSEIQKKINEITKSHLLKIMLKFIEDNYDKNLVILDIPILFENNLQIYCDKVLVILSERSEQISRICKRDNVEIEIAENRLNIQNSNEYYVSKSDFVINNFNKTKVDLKYEVEEIYNNIFVTI